MKILNPALQVQQWLSIEFSVLDPGKDIDIVVLVPPNPLLSNPLPSVKTAAAGVLLGGDCEFLGYPYGGGWRGNFNNGASAWMPFVKHCFISALASQKDQKVWVLDGINNAGFSGGPVASHTGEDQQIFAVVSGYQTEPADVVTSPLEKLKPASSHPPHKPSQKTGNTKQTVNVNSGFIIAFDIGYALETIHNYPIGPIRNAR